MIFDSTLAPFLGALLLALGAEARAAPGGELLEPPEGFVRLEAAVFGGSKALIPLLAPGARGEAVAAWADLSCGASLVLGKVQARLELGREQGDEIPLAIAGHLRAGLDLEATVEAATLRVGPHGGRWEARAATRAGGGARTVRFAFYPAGEVHYVLAASFPPEQQERLAGRLDRAFEGFAPEVERGPRWSAPLAGAGLTGLVLLAAAAVLRGRRRAAARRARGDEVETAP